MKALKPFLLALVAVVAAFAAVSYLPGKPQEGLRLETLVIESRGGQRHSFEVEVADTPESQITGLMFREHMPPDHGMLFEMGEERVIGFWMKNTLIPLDMLFISAAGEIRKIHENAVPRSLEGISSDVPVAAVLELNGGRAKALGISAGDRVIHPYFSPHKNN